jgi:serine/threonine-protein kinase PknG
LSAGAAAPAAAPAGRAGTGSAPVSGRSGSLGSGRSGSSGSRRGSRGSQGTTRRSLGAGLINLEPLPTIDPMQSVLADPVVPDGKRFCPQCNARLNHAHGFCPMCGVEYSFVPTLSPGDMVGEQYEVKGAIAFGGLGWIYLGWDTVLSRWVVLKGLLNSKDEASAQAAVAERQFLAAVKHPNIVGVYNFVAQGSDGYIVMEYVGGKSIKTIRKERGPLPVAEAIAYTHRILLAFSYLHRMGLVYCDFKPDNCMIEGDDVKLIDMGGVRRMDDPGGDVYGTKGYSAPEASDEPSIVSDLFTVGRTLAVLVADFKFQSGAYEFSLPPPAEEPLFAQHESLYRLLLKATRRDPDERFQSADEMAAQLVGVLRETVAADGTPRAVESSLFTGENSDAAGAEAAPDWHTLPAAKSNPQDPAASVILSAAAITDPEKLAALFERGCEQYPDSFEAPLLLARTRIEQGRYDEAEQRLAEVEARDPFDWQVWWLRGVSLLAQAHAREAAALFDRVYGEAPGELAPQLALAFAAEASGDRDTAARLYDVVSRTDPTFTSAAFGLARCLQTHGDRRGAVAAYARVPATSSRHLRAQMALARALVGGSNGVRPEPPAEADLVQASATIEALTVDGYEFHQLCTQVLRAAVAQVEARAIAENGGTKVLGQPLRRNALRAAVERELRACARYAKSPEEKIALVDAANRERPRTLV